MRKIILRNIAAACVTFLFVRLFPRELSLAPAGAAGGTGLSRKSRRYSPVTDRTIVLILLSFALCLVMDGFLNRPVKGDPF